MKKIPQHFLANFMGMDRRPRAVAIEKFHLSSGGIWSYDAFLKSASEILGADAGLLGKLAPISDIQLAAVIRQNCKTGNEDEFRRNLEVARLLVAFTNSTEVEARKFPMASVRFGSAEYLRFWHDIVVAIDGQRYVLSVDPKVSGLTSDGQRIVASIVRHGLIGETPQLANFNTLILGFPNVSKGRRAAHTTVVPDGELYTFDELRLRYVETYSQYADLIAKLRKSSSGSSEGSGGLF